MAERVETRSRVPRDEKRKMREAPVSKYQLRSSSNSVINPRMQARPSRSLHRLPLPFLYLRLLLPLPLLLILSRLLPRKTHFRFPSLTSFILFLSHSSYFSFAASIPTSCSCSPSPPCLLLRFSVSFLSVSFSFIILFYFFAVSFMNTFFSRSLPPHTPSLLSRPLSFFPQPTSPPHFYPVFYLSTLLFLIPSSHPPFPPFHSS